MPAVRKCQTRAVSDGWPSKACRATDPSGGERYDGQRLLAAKDPFALDYGALKLFGVEPDWTPVHREAVKLGLVNPAEIELIALEETWESLCRSDFRLPETMKGLIQLIPSPLAALRRHFAPYPKPDPSRCLGCGECVRVVRFRR